LNASLGKHFSSTRSTRAAAHNCDSQHLETF
jgi:hypothetical protein